MGLTEMVENADSKMLAAAQKLGDYWQDKTGKSARELERKLYGFASFSYLTDSILQQNYLSFIPFIFAGVEYMGRRIASKDIKEIEDSYGYLNSRQRGFRFGLAAIGASATSIGISLLLHTYFGNKDYLEPAKNSLLMGAGTVSYALAEYLTASRFDPPKKKQKETVKEKVKKLLESLKPQPLPSPIPAPTKYEALS